MVDAPTLIVFKQLRWNYSRCSYFYNIPASFALKERDQGTNHGTARKLLLRHFAKDGIRNI